jgi:hypothetical protein
MANITREALDARIADKVAQIAALQVQRAELAAKVIEQGAAIAELHHWVAFLDGAPND